MPSTPVRTLLAWIGHTDLRAMLPSLSAEDRAMVVAGLPPGGGEQTPKDGPIRTLLERQPELAGEVHLFSNDRPAVGKLFARWLGCKPQLHHVTITGPTDYQSIYQVVDTEVASILGNRRGVELNVHLSPGTPAMAAIWVLLGKSKYPARFWQTHNGKAWETAIPFDLTLEVIPEVLRNADAPFHHLISRGPGQIDGFQAIVGDGSAIRLAVGRAQRAALRDVSVLLLGESGTGKELFARAIQAASRRRDKPFEVLNCAAVPENLLETELFGHVKGAFTGATGKKDGAFKRADGGTLFLDEIGECPPVLQAKLLRVLQPPPSTSLTTREFQPVGSEKPVRSDVRIIAATNRNLSTEVQNARFRGDLYHRLAAITIQLPPLRERKADIVHIAESLLDAINKQFQEGDPGYRHKTLSGPAKQFVKTYGWPGNVRELHNALLQAAVMAEGEALNRADIELAVPSSSSLVQSDLLELPLGDGFNLEQHLERIQAHFLRRAMAEARGNKTAAARLLGLKHYQTLDQQLKRLGVTWEGGNG